MFTKKVLDQSGWANLLSLGTGLRPSTSLDQSLFPRPSKLVLPLLCRTS